MEEQGKGPQEMAFVRTSATSFQAKTQGWAGSGQALPPEATLRSTCPTLEISGQVHRVPGVVSVELEALPATQRTARCPMDHTSQNVSHPHRGTVTGKH